MENQAVCFQTEISPQMLCGYDKEKYNGFVNQLTVFIKEVFVENGITNFITGGEQGFDHLVFWSINRLKKDFPEIKNNLCLRGEYQKDELPKKGLFSQMEFRQMLKLADNIQYAENKEFDDKVFDRLVREDIMLDKSDVIVTIGTDFEPYTYYKVKNKEESGYSHEISPNMTFVASSSFRGSEGQPIEPRHDIYYLRYQNKDDNLEIINAMRYTPKITMEINSYEDSKKNWININNIWNNYGVYKYSIAPTLWDYDIERIDFEDYEEER